MKQLTRNPRFRAILAVCLLGTLAAIAIRSASSQDIPVPVLSITTTNTNQVQITITNGVGFANYEVYRRPLFNDAYPWYLTLIGTPGQTNFTMDMGVDYIGFFRVGVGTNWDGDLVPNYQDANPLSTNVGILSITIDSPTNGQVLN